MKDYSDTIEQKRQHYKGMVRDCLKHMEAHVWSNRRMDDFVEYLMSVEGDWVTMPDMRVLVRVHNRRPE